MARMVVPLKMRQYNPDVRMVAFEPDAPTLFDRMTGGNPGMDEKTAYLRGMLGGRSPFRMNEVESERARLMNPMNIGALLQALKERKNATR